MTATATYKVRQDVLIRMGMKNVILFTQSFNRHNLRYEVRAKNNKSVEDMAAFITNNYAGATGIIYCLSRSECERTAEQLAVRPAFLPSPVSTRRSQLIVAPPAPATMTTDRINGECRRRTTTPACSSRSGTEDTSYG